MTSGPRITPVILSGGAGTRLWPLSSEAMPKQFHAIGGGETLLQLTARRVRGDGLFGAPIVVVGAAHADIAERQLDDAGAPAGLLILEPCARNTAPAIALAALAAAPDDLLLAMPSDHLIADTDAFHRGVAAAVPFAEDGWLVTFGARPDRPETGFGYIRRGGEIGAGVFAAEAFVEKPDMATAQAFVADGRYDWNGGIFLFRAATFLAELDRHSPAIASAARAAAAGRRSEGARLHPDARAFAASPAQSIDYALMEKAKRVAVVPVAMGWSDVGSWDALYDISKKDAAGNALSGDAHPLGSGNSLIHSDGPAVVAVGVEDLIVVAAEGAVLVVPRGRSQLVKQAMDALRERRQEAARTSDGENDG